MHHQLHYHMGQIHLGSSQPPNPDLIPKFSNFFVEGWSMKIQSNVQEVSTIVRLDGMRAFLLGVHSVVSLDNKSIFCNLAAHFKTKMNLNPLPHWHVWSSPLQTKKNGALAFPLSVVFLKLDDEVRCSVSPLWHGRGAQPPSAGGTPGAHSWVLVWSNLCIYKLPSDSPIFCPPPSGSRTRLAGGPLPKTSKEAWFYPSIHPPDMHNAYSHTSLS